MAQKFKSKARTSSALIGPGSNDSIGLGRLTIVTEAHTSLENDENEEPDEKEEDSNKLKEEIDDYFEHEEIGQNMKKKIHKAE